MAEYKIRVATSQGPLADTTDANVLGDGEPGSIAFEPALAIGGTTNFQAVTMFDLLASGLTVGMDIETAKIELRVSSTSPALSDFDYILDFVVDDGNEKLSLAPQPVEVIHNQGRFMGGVREVLTALSPSNTASTVGNDFLRMWIPSPGTESLNPDGFELRVSQAYTIDLAGVVTHGRFEVMRAGVTSGTRVWAELYSATGSPGNYKRGQLLSTGFSEAVQFDSLPVADPASYVSIWAAPNGGPYASVSPGDVVILDLVLEKPTADVFALLDIYMGTLETTAPGLGVIDNALVYADQSEGFVLQGFASKTNFLTGQSIKTMPSTGSSVTLPRPLVPWDTDELISIGDVGSGETIEVPGFNALVQEAIYESSNGFIAMRHSRGAFVNIGNDRFFHSSRSATETIPGYKGLVLSVTTSDKGKFASQGVEITSGVSYQTETTRGVSATVGIGAYNDD